jgi:hypothetical protein
MVRVLEHWSDHNAVRLGVDRKTLLDELLPPCCLFNSDMRDAVLGVGSRLNDMFL